MCIKAQSSGPKRKQQHFIEKETVKQRRWGKKDEHDTEIINSFLYFDIWAWYLENDLFSMGMWE